MTDAWLGGYRDKTVVVTGAAGFIGGRVVNRLLGTACRIVRVARVAPAAAAPTAAQVVDVIGDVRQRAVWEEALAAADVVVHLAAQTSGPAAEGDPNWDLEANVVPLRQLLAACREGGRRPAILFAGTVTESGVASQLPVDEDVPDHPVTVYDQHKLMAEHELKRAVLEGQACGATLRLANVYGPGSPGTSHDRDVMNRMIKAALRGEPLTVYGGGEYLRDYLFIEDAVDAFLMAGAQAARVNGRHYVVGSGRGVTIRDAFELVSARVERVTGRRVPVIAAESAEPLSPIQRRHFVADPGRLAADTGWRAEWSLSDGIDRTIEAYACA